MNKLNIQYAYVVVAYIYRQAIRLAQTSMLFFQNYICNDVFSIFQPLVYLSCYRLIKRDGIENTRPSCLELCSSQKTKIVSYKEWNSLNSSYLQETCEVENSNLTGPATMKKKTCDFTVALEYDFIKSTWQSHGSQIDDLTWKSSFYPRLNDLVVICDLRVSLMPNYSESIFSTNIPRYCISSSTMFDLNRTNYLHYQKFDKKLIAHVFENLYFFIILKSFRI